MLNNENNLENQQIGWLEEQLSQHYKKQPLREQRRRATDIGNSF